MAGVLQPSLHSCHPSFCLAQKRNLPDAKRSYAWRKISLCEDEIIFREGVLSTNSFQEEKLKKFWKKLMKSWANKLFIPLMHPNPSLRSE